MDEPFLRVGKINILVMQKDQVRLKILDTRLRGYDRTSRLYRHTRKGGYPVLRLFPAHLGVLHNLLKQLLIGMSEANTTISHYSLDIRHF
jgi:hypothetical protein